MSLSIYSKYKMDNWKYLIEADVIKYDDADKRTESSAYLYYSDNIYDDAFHTTYSGWNDAHNILFNSATEDERHSFFRDDFGFIPPHILKRITQSSSFQHNRDEIEYRLEGLMECSCNHNEIIELEHTMKILDFIVKRADEGICYQ
jgi:hypothetical protein